MRRQAETNGELFAFSLLRLLFIKLQFRHGTRDHEHVLYVHFRWFAPKVLPWNLLHYRNEEECTFKMIDPTNPFFTWRGRFKKSSASVFTFYT